MERNHLVTTLVAAAAIGVGVYFYLNSSSPISDSSSRSTPSPAPTTNERSIETQPAKPVVKETPAPAPALKLRNHAFVFIKPHANTPATQELVVDDDSPLHCQE